MSTYSIILLLSSIISSSLILSRLIISHLIYIQYYNHLLLSYSISFYPPGAKHSRNHTPSYNILSHLLYLSRVCACVCGLTLPYLDPRVGEGPFPTELEDEDCLKLRRIGACCAVLCCVAMACIVLCCAAPNLFSSVWLHCGFFSRHDCTLQWIVLPAELILLREALEECCVVLCCVVLCCVVLCCDLYESSQLALKQSLFLPQAVSSAPPPVDPVDAAGSTSHSWSMPLWSTVRSYHIKLYWFDMSWIGFNYIIFSLRVIKCNIVFFIFCVYVDSSRLIKYFLPVFNLSHCTLYSILSLFYTEYFFMRIWKSTFCVFMFSVMFRNRDFFIFLPFFRVHGNQFNEIGRIEWIPRSKNRACVHLERTASDRHAF